METGSLNINQANVLYSRLCGAGGEWMQFWYTIVPEKTEPIANQLATIENAEAALFQELNIGRETIMLRRFFSSDLVSHHEVMTGYKRRQPADFFMSLTEQPPASGVKLAVLGMCLSNITAKSRNGRIFCVETTSRIRHIFAEHLMDPDAGEFSDAELQTGKIFKILKEKLAVFNTTIEDSVIRTWIYAPHVDADYPGIVKARKEIFDSINLTRDTHYIASTGIQGGSGNRFARVFMDAYAVTGVSRDRVRYIQAPEYLSPTHMYGVTFERATAILLGNTDFLFISGTASIDKKGDIVHPGSIEKQAERTMVNISALLDAAGFGVKDLTSFIVYLRDPSDYGIVKPLIDKYAVNLPAIYVKAFVCRPGWLIEIEATAARAREQ